MVEVSIRFDSSSGSFEGDRITSLIAAYEGVVRAELDQPQRAPGKEGGRVLEGEFTRVNEPKIDIKLIPKI